MSKKIDLEELIHLREDIKEHIDYPPECSPKGIKELSEILEYVKAAGFEKGHPIYQDLLTMFDYLINHDEYINTLNEYVKKINFSSKERRTLIALLSYDDMRLETFPRSLVYNEDINEEYILMKKEDPDAYADIREALERQGFCKKYKTFFCERETNR